MESIAIQSGPVTIDDVAAACAQAGVTPGETNASKIRITLGRGSFATIQKHLESLRTDAMKAQEPTATIAAPSPPADLVAAVWSAAYSAAGHQLAARFATVLTERDMAREAAASSSADVAALAGQVDELEAASAQTRVEHQRAMTDRDFAVQSFHQYRQGADDQIAKLVADAEKLKLEAAHQAELAVRDKTIERQSLQSTIDRLTDQVGELKGLLSIQARPASV